ncbi:acyltransferase [Desulfovibrio mangrovi]|uniref:acyltransferase family protein n=1 Tax=Desulfovibrio mangrovi TaxID=2976983 RepID=UPI002246BF66|nr:acyltransferase family protein [Desulfovibrio mangrovi]UZP66627.1 acyltransferase [Desulfovibrio mangrovi]
MSSLKYRPEIDGLRAIAVMLVVIYHAGITLGGVDIFPGGFLGVDVFFVISGYLITKIINRELDAGNFSIIRFYERRARRIIPALTAVLFVTGILCWHFLPPEPFVEYGKSLLSTVSFVANIFFYLQDSYSAEASNLKPLLHMWSLGVEEQFYLFYPLLLMLIAKMKKGNRGVFILFALSLAACEYLSHVDNDFNFFMLPTRAWELLAGGMAAIYENELKRMVASRSIRHWLLIGALLTITLSSIFLSESSRLPSLQAVFLVGFTACLIIFADSATIAGRIIANPVAVFIGLRSYSLYLWHQPLFAVSRTALGRNLHNSESLALIGLCLLLSDLSYRFVETPFRSPKGYSRKSIFVITAASCLASVLFGTVIIANKGLDMRFPAVKNFLADYDFGYDAYKRDGYLSLAKQSGIDTSKAPALFSFNNAEGYTLVTLGDSHIRTLNAPIITGRDNLPYISALAPMDVSSGLFVLGLDVARDINVPQQTLGIEKKNVERLERIRGLHNPIVIIGSRLPLYLSAMRFDNKEGGIEEGDDHFGITIDTPSGKRRATTAEVVAAMRQTVDQLLNMNCKVILLYPIPEAGWNVPAKIMLETRSLSADATRAYLSDKTRVATRYSVFKDRTHEAYEVLNAVGDNENLLRVFPEDVFCDGQLCYSYGETTYYRDDDHLSYQGAQRLLDHIAMKMQGQWPRLQSYAAKE